MEHMLVKTENVANFPPPLVEFFNPQNGRRQYGFPDVDGSCANPVFELEPHGNSFKLLLLGSPQGPVQTDADGKVTVSR